MSTKPSTIQQSKDQLDMQLVLGVMNTVESDADLSQRQMASELGVAVGLVNTYLKRCIKKGWIKARKVPARRYAYYLTPQGFREKSRLVAKYLNSSLHFFQNARIQCETVMQACADTGVDTIALYGESDLSEIAELVAHKMGLATRILTTPERADAFKAILITDIDTPQQAYATLRETVGDEVIHTLDILHIRRDTAPAVKEVA